jgi:hypothetical protein
MVHIEATKAYREGAAACSAYQLKAIYEELIEQVDDSKALSSVPEADLEALNAYESELTTPLDQEVVTIEVTRKDKTRETRDVTLGERLQAFQILVERKRPEIESLIKEVQDIDAQIADAMKDILATEEGDVLRARQELDAALAKLKEDAHRAKEQTLKDVQSARKDEQRMAAEEKRKLYEFMATL